MNQVFLLIAPILIMKSIQLASATIAAIVTIAPVAPGAALSLFRVLPFH